jgi:hypothetical protein
LVIFFVMQCGQSFSRSISNSSLECPPLGGSLDHLVNTADMTGRSDEDITPMDTNNTPQADIQGPITRARTRQLNLQVISFLHNYSCAFESSMLPNDLIVLRNEGEDQQGHVERPLRRGGPAKMSGSRWKPKPVRLCFSFGLQEQPVLKRTPMSHTESDLDVLYMDGNIISISFQWNRFQAQIHPESTGIVCTSDIQNLFRCCDAVFWPDGPCIQLESIRDVS